MELKKLLIQAPVPLEVLLLRAEGSLVLLIVQQEVLPCKALRDSDHFLVSFFDLGHIDRWKLINFFFLGRDFVRILL